MIDWATPLFVFSDEDVERLARLEHDRWCADRRRDGWTPGSVRDAEKRRHPDPVPWEQPSEAVRDKDREAVCLVARMLATYAGFTIVVRSPDDPPLSMSPVPAASKVIA